MLEKNAEGDMLRKSIGVGKPAPVSLMKTFLKRVLSKSSKNKTLLFLGNPRLKPEAQLLKKILSERKEKFFVFYISLPDKEVRKRSALRMRNTDDAKYITKRIKWHKEQVGKTVKYFKSLGAFKEIKGNRSIAQVYRDIVKAIEYEQDLLDKK